jgi:hypothetical protein
VSTSRVPSRAYSRIAAKQWVLLYHKKISGRNSDRLTSPCVACSILSDSSGEAFRLPFIIKDNHVGDMRRYSAISDLAPLGSVEKYSVSVIRHTIS